MKIFIGKKYSCELNYQHDYILKSLYAKYEITEKVSEADIIIFASSCSFTERVILEEIAYFSDCISKKKKGAQVYLTGCLTREFKNPSLSQNIQDWLKNNIDYLIPQNTPNLLLQKIDSSFNNLKTDDFGYVTGSNISDLAVIYIGNGCRCNCAFCKVSYQYYPLKSVKIEEIKDAIDEVNEYNYSYLSVRATNLSQCGLDLYEKPILPEIIDYIESKDKILQYELIGFSYRDAIKYHFEDCLSKSRKLDYISGSLESGSPRLLEMIRKGFTPEEIINFIKKINRYRHINLDLNIIAGLPTETLEDIKETLEVLKQINPYCVSISDYISSKYLTYLNSFPQLTDREIANHRNIYNEILTRRKVRTRIFYK